MEEVESASYQHYIGLICVLILLLCSDICQFLLTGPVDLRNWVNTGRSLCFDISVHWGVAKRA